MSNIIRLPADRIEDVTVACDGCGLRVAFGTCTVEDDLVLCSGCLCPACGGRPPRCCDVSSARPTGRVLS